VAALFVSMRNDPETVRSLNPIVLVEDHPLHGRLLRRALERHVDGRPIELIPDGTEAAQRLFDPALPLPALLVFDLDVPGRGGHDLLAARARDSRLAAVPAAVVTSSAAPADRERSLALGATLHVSKPEDGEGFAHLADRLASLIG
jgi:CheY-like chemotaxis protein